MDENEEKLLRSVALQTAKSILIARQQAEEALRESEERLKAELAATQQLHEISTRLIREGDFVQLYHGILDAAIGIMKSDMASMQLVDAGKDVLRMLAWRGFDPMFGQTFAVNRPETNTSCSVAWRAGHRVIVPDVETCEFIVGTPALEDHRKTGIRAVQSTPLVSRDGRTLGMISTHWRNPHQPDERDLRLLDILARQAADLIERKQAEESVRTSEERYRSLVSVITDVPWTTDAEGRFVTPQPAWAAYTGQSWDELRDFGWANALHPEDRENVGATWQRACETRSLYESHGRLWHAPSRQYRYFEARATPLIHPDDSVREWVGTCTDVHERKIAEEAKARLAAIVESSDDAIVSKDLNGIITSWNHGAERLFGYTAQEAIGQPVTMLIPADRIDEEPGILERIRRGERIEQYETVRRRKDGTLLDISLTVSPITDAQGTIVGASKIARDITDRKRAEEALQTLNVQLEERVVRRTGELVSTVAQREKLQEQLSQAQKMESIGTLASGVAHDFNNILNVILSYASLLRRNPGNPAKLLESVEVINDTVKRGAALVQQLLAIGRKTAIKFEKVDINTAIKNLETLVKETFPKTITVSFVLDKAVPTVLADANQINQVLLNLCVNARDAMPNGGDINLATGTISGSELRRRFQDARESQYAWISVADTGMGMDETTKNRIFEPFFTTKEPGQGTGLGLSVVYGIISNHGGFVNVESRPGQGTTFQIYLPNVGDGAQFADSAQPQLEYAEPAQISGAGETILFVDDEARQLRMMKGFLENEGYRVLDAVDGPEAIEMYLRHRDEIAVVVLDLGLPKLNGWDAFQRMRKEDSRVKVLLATGYLSPEIESQIAQWGVSGVLMKPYQIDDVLAKIRDAVRTKGREGHGDGDGNTARDRGTNSEVRSQRSEESKN